MAFTNIFDQINIFSYDCDFRTACAIMKYCILFLGPEGGFPHAAAWGLRDWVVTVIWAWGLAFIFRSA